MTMGNTDSEGCKQPEESGKSGNFNAFIYILPTHKWKAFRQLSFLITVITYKYYIKVACLCVWKSALLSQYSCAIPCIFLSFISICKCGCVIVRHNPKNFSYTGFTVA
jgi:uncharacterized membrane protein YesL